MLRLSLNCRDALDEGAPLESHVCTGCEDCPCHAEIGVPVPPNDSFREAREELAERLAARRETDPEEDE